ncbi:hypothetical protein PVAP13_3KG485344 [Panicum virgatum]|uniref:Uncharacterized protein n=1 Tax=Panicum virgatum TaxID=38727 RepID=A0A8T0UXI7_PANVG|nr:hypothetical protein PVAP13_3KG485344 [Panicum virgatum]
MCAGRCSSSLAGACEWKGSHINAPHPLQRPALSPQYPIPTSPSTVAASRRGRRLEGSRSFSNGLAEAGRGLSKLSRIATLRGAQPPPLSSPIGSDPIFGTDPHFHAGAGDGDRPSAPSPAAAPLCSSNPAPTAATLLKRAAGAGALHLPAASPPALGSSGARLLTALGSLSRPRPRPLAPSLRCGDVPAGSAGGSEQPRNHASALAQHAAPPPLLQNFRRLPPLPNFPPFIQLDIWIES